MTMASGASTIPMGRERGDAVRFLELVLHAEFATVAGAHHMVAGDDNAVFERVLDDFLDRRIRSRLRLLHDRT